MIWDVTCLQVHVLQTHLDFFSENLGDVIDEHGERFHQDNPVMERRFKGKLNPGMLAYYCWGIKKIILHTKGIERQNLFKLTGVFFQFITNKWFVKEAKFFFCFLQLSVFAMLYSMPNIM